MKVSVEKNRAEWLVSAALILLSVVPVAAGAVRMGQLTGGAEITPEKGASPDATGPALEDAHFSFF